MHVACGPPVFIHYASSSSSSDREVSKGLFRALHPTSFNVCTTTHMYYCLASLRLLKALLLLRLLLLRRLQEEEHGGREHGEEEDSTCIDDE